MRKLGPLILVVLLLAGLGIGGYFVYQRGYLSSWWGGETPGAGQSAGEGAQPAANPEMEDLKIRVAILEAFGRSPELPARGINVKVENKMVTLSGVVETPAQRAGAEQTVRAVSGVAGVTNELTVTNPQAPAEPPKTNAPPADLNAELAKKVEFDLYRTTAFDVNAMTISAKDGTITLSGSVRSVAEKLLAERVAQGTPGVTKVVNELRVAAPPAAPGK